MDQPDAEALFAMAMAEPSAPLSLDLFAHSIRRRWEHSGDVVAIHRDPGTADPEIRAAEADTLARRRVGLLGLANVLAPALRPDVDVAEASAILDALTLAEVYAELVEVQGWTPDRYETWVAAVLIEELLVADG